VPVSSKNARFVLCHNFFNSRPLNEKKGQPFHLYTTATLPRMGRDQSRKNIFSEGIFFTMGAQYYKVETTRTKTFHYSGPVSVKIFQYQIDQQHQTLIWVCNTCKKANWEKILLKAWKLIDSDEATSHRCALCSQRQTGGPSEVSSASEAA
jgi:hypothetical protein